MFPNGGGVDADQHRSDGPDHRHQPGDCTQRSTRSRQTPVEGVNWAKGPNFGKALNRFAYTTPRTFRLNVRRAVLGTAVGFNVRQFRLAGGADPARARFLCRRCILIA